jgi:Ala-tRNA(Pro) deacylase
MTGLAMPATRADLMAYLAELGISTTTVEHAAVYTVAESDALHRDIVGGHTKNLFLKDAKGQLFLVVAEAHTAIDLKALHKVLGCGRLSFGRADLLMDVLGVPAGSVTAFSLINDRGNRVKVVIDMALIGHEVINCHPLVNTATTSIKQDDLFRFIRTLGHEPTTARLTGPLDGP